jgi:hypothetical protein
MQDESRPASGSWTPPPRPEWVAQVIAEGECMDIRGVVPLDAGSLVATARRNTGLDDFGADEWVEPFEVFMRSLEEDADLHLLGRLLARAEILNLLEVRLQVENEFRLHPEIADEEIAKPVFIMGQGRSGTSALQNLISADPRFRTLTTWETMYPAPPPTPAMYHDNPRIEKADKFIKSWARVTPELKAMHEYGGRIPQECCKAHALTFRSEAWLGVIGQALSYSQYMMDQDMVPAYRYQKRLMQLLQWRNPREHWILKSPIHLDFLPQALEAFPDACFVWTHRDPVKAFASVVSLIGTAQWGRCNEPFKGASYSFVTDLGLASRRLGQVIDWMEQGTVPAERICNIQYLDLIGSPLATVESIYRYFGVELAADVRAVLADYHFLSPGNPMATDDQRDLEALALQVMQTPKVAKAKQLASVRWKTLVGSDVPAEAWDTFDDVLDEWAYNYCLKAANSDPNHPRVLSNIYCPPHEWFAMKVPGNRGFGGDNPDAIYTIVPIDANGHYELTGQRSQPTVCDVPFQVCSNPSLSSTVDAIAWQDIQFEPDGRFTVTLASDRGGPNHLRTGIDARWLLIRDIRADWRQIPNGYVVRRLDPPLADPFTFDEFVERAARFIVDDVTAAHFWLAMIARLHDNAVTEPFCTGLVGGMFTQWMAMARLNIHDDEAFVLTLGTGGAQYRGLVLMDFWQHSMSHGTRTSSLSNAQSAPDLDGTTTFVISIADPGVHNWIDTVGLHQPRIMARWQVLPSDPAERVPPTVHGQLVKLSKLDSVLPPETKRVTPAARSAQLSERIAQYNRRFLDH